MTAEWTGFLGLVVLLALLFLRVPVAVAMGVVGVSGMMALLGMGAGVSLLRTAPWTSVASYDYAVIPLFMFMGNICFHSGISEELFRMLHRLVGHFRGGLALATVGACAGFAALSGTTLATAVTMGAVALPEMKKLGYDPALSTGVVAAGGTLGVLIPPSTVLVIYGMLTEQNIAELFMAGIVPGILQALFYAVTVAVVCRMKPDAGPACAPFPWKERLVSLRASWPVLALFALIMGGICRGWFSPSEAAAVGASGALVLALLRRRLTMHAFGASLMEAVKSTAMIMIVMVGAMLLGYFFSVTRIPFTLASEVSALEISPVMIMVTLVVMYVLLGCVMIPIAMIVLTMPIVFPLITSLGYDPVWFGIIVVRIFEIAQITPPVGLNVFVIKSVAHDVPLTTIFRGVSWFLVADILHLAMLFAFSGLSLWLPSLMQ
ncbi:TRAP transporter large permease [Mailhella massiliensis]|uniref:TRAP transporter large permease n=1 Tax=Mailhella massiliensis TaxID=1903261 RepID=A0A921AV71_9BACT|nr:TRAP transporter large permease [Mailhella massiliensis]HJD96343.1 TRAP transporter large permease [Mailhella massiliensis]